MKRIGRGAFLRRAASIGVAATGAGTVVKVASAGSGSIAPPPPPDAGGVVTTLSSDGLVIQQQQGRPDVHVKFSDGIRAWRPGEVDPGSFSVGDEVVLFGAFDSDGTLVASRIESLMAVVRETVTDRRGDIVSTNLRDDQPQGRNAAQ